MITVDIKKNIGQLSENDSGWKKELNIVSWNDQPPKLDIRTWSPDHQKTGKGITLTEEEGRNLAALLNEFFAKKDAEKEGLE